MNSDDLIHRVTSLIEKGERLLKTYKAPPDNFIGFEGWVDTDLFAEWRSQALTYLTNTLGSDHPYTVQFVETVTEAVPSSNKHGLGILRAVREDMQGGFLVRVRDLVAAEVFDSFLEMAEHLAEQEFIAAAASLSGAVLEDSLRRCAVKRGLKPAGNLESLNNVLADAEVYSRNAQRQVKHWIGLRNDADHGQFDRVTAEADAVRSMLRDLPGFLERLATQ